MMDMRAILQLDALAFADALERLADEMILEEPLDIQRLRDRKVDTGREFAVWEYTVGYCMNFSDQLSLLRKQASDAQAGTAPGDLATLRLVAVNLCDWYAGSFDVTGKMCDAEAIIRAAGGLFESASDHHAYTRLCRGLERYLVQLLFWIDRQIPWSAVSDLVHGYRLRP